MAGNRGESFDARLRRLREAAGFTQEELAHAAGLSVNAVSQLERGLRKRPYPHTVRALAAALGLNDVEHARLLATVPKRGATEPPGGMSSLPAPATPLIGREKELAAVLSFFQEPGRRLLTLTGTGGVGKTRLALDVAHELAGAFTDGVFFVALAQLKGPDLVLPTVAQALGLPQSGGTVAETVHRYLRGKSLLLVLDNFEHLLDAAPEVAALLAAGPTSKILATSRAPLRLRGEQEYPLAPLAFPDPAQMPDPESVAGYPAVKLFSARVREANPGFPLGADSAGAVAAICWRLGGIPLALELAASGAKFLGPNKLLLGLDRALEAGGARDLPLRQRTMQATIDWSFERLSDAEKALFRRLSAFAAGFSLEAAAEVGDGPDASGLLAKLIEQSLVTAGFSGDDMRYTMLEPIRQYASRKLEESGESDAVRNRHAMYFLSRAEWAAPGLWGGDQMGYLESLDLDVDNFRAAISWSIAAGEAETAVRIGWALWLFWWLRGRQLEGSLWMEPVLELEMPPVLRVRALIVRAIMAYAQGDHQVHEKHANEALELALRHGDDITRGYALAGVGLARMHQQHCGEASRLMNDSRLLFESSREKGMLPMVHTWLGIISLEQGDFDDAAQAFEDAARDAGVSGSRIGAVTALYNLARLALVQGDSQRAMMLLHQAIDLCGQTKDYGHLGYCLQTLAVVTRPEDGAERKAVLLGAAESLLEVAGAPAQSLYAPDPGRLEEAVAAMKAALGEAAFELASETGARMTFEQVIEYAGKDDGGAAQG